MSIAGMGARSALLSSQGGGGTLPRRGRSGVIADRLRRYARAIVVAPMVGYAKLISPAIPRRCRYEPTCSAYAIEAVRRFGVVRGLILAGWRLLRCNPFSDGGYDPVEAQRLFKHHRHADA